MFKLSEPFNYLNDFNYANSFPRDFWDEVAKKHVFCSGDKIYPDWFKGGELNTYYNVLDILIKNPLKRDQVALIYECPYLKKTVKLIYYQLDEKVCEFSRVLLNLNILKNDNVLIYMSNTVEPLITMLSCARIGATHCVLFDVYSVKSLIDRIETITPKLIITTNYGIFNDEIINFIPNLQLVIAVRSNGPHLVCLNCHNQYILQNYESITALTISNVGWVSFHGLVYGILSVGFSLVMYEGGIIKNKHMEVDFWETLEKHKVTHTHSFAKTIRYLIKTDPEGTIVRSKYDLSNQI
ncbi:hypothetical protein ACTFIY_009059 [Dictyostelium cf. discoideum]